MPAERVLDHVFFEPAGSFFNTPGLQLNGAKTAPAVPQLQIRLGARTLTRAAQPLDGCRGRFMVDFAARSFRTSESNPLNSTSEVFMKLNHRHRLHQPWRLVLATGIVFVALTSARAASDNSSIERALRELDTQWSAAASARNLDQVVSYYSSDAIVLAPNMPVTSSGEAIRKIWKGELDGMISGGWKPTRIEVAKSGDLAYISGTYTWAGRGADGKEIKDEGKYLEVWKKQADGSWKCSADCWNSDLPLPGAKG